MANEPANTNNTPNDQNTDQDKGQGNDTKTLEERIKALEAENGKLRQANTNASADASRFKKESSEWKQKYESKLSDEDKAKEQQEQANAALQQELENLRTERNIAKYSATLVSQDIGMDAETAMAVAEALNAGETEKVFDGIRKFISAHDKALREDALRNNKTLPGGNATKTVTQAEFDAMSLSEMIAFKKDHPEQYAEFTK